MPVCMWKVVHWQTFSVFLEIEPSSHVEPQSSCKNNKKGKREETKRLPLVFPCVLEDKLAKCRSMGWDHKASNSWWRIQLSLYLESLCVRVCARGGGGVYLWLPHQHTKPQIDTHTYTVAIVYHMAHRTPHTQSLNFIHWETCKQASTVQTGNDNFTANSAKETPEYTHFCLSVFLRGFVDNASPLL